MLDGDKNPAYTLQSIANFLQRFGINVPAAALSSKNIAAVMITADISAFKKNGSRIDVRSSSRYGAFDFGANAARVRALIEDIDDAVDKEKPEAPAAPPAKKAKAQPKANQPPAKR